MKLERIILFFISYNVLAFVDSDDSDSDDEDDSEMAMMTTCCCCFSTKNGSVGVGIICLVSSYWWHRMPGESVLGHRMPGEYILRDRMPGE